MAFAHGWPRKVVVWCCPAAVPRDANGSRSESCSRRILPAAKLPFRPTQRLRCKSDFDRVYKEGRRHADGLFALAVRLNALPAPRLGLAIAAKTVGNSVRRNRVKRLIRESFRAHQHELPAVDVVVNARSAARDATNERLTESLEQHWRRVANTCARASSR